MIFAKELVRKMELYITTETVQLQGKAVFQKVLPYAIEMANRQNKVSAAWFRHQWLMNR